MANGQPQLVEVVWYAIDLAPEPLTTNERQDAYDQLQKIGQNNDGRGEVQPQSEQPKK